MMGEVIKTWAFWPGRGKLISVMIVMSWRHELTSIYVISRRKGYLITRGHPEVATKTKLLRLIILLFTFDCMISLYPLIMSSLWSSCPLSHFIVKLDRPEIQSGREVASGQPTTSIWLLLLLLREEIQVENFLFHNNNNGPHCCEILL